MKPEEYESTYDPNEIGGDIKLRISKSSFMQARQCLRKYWWNKVQFPDVWLPPTEAILRGNAVHESLEKVYTEYSGETVLRPLFPYDEYEDTYDALAFLEQQRLEAWGRGHFKPIEHEKKRKVYDPVNDVVMVGAWDGLLEHPNGEGLVLVELKTGDLSSSKLSRVRRELCFYARMIELLGYTKPVTHMMLISSDCTNDRTAKMVLKQKNKEIFLGEEKGITIIERLGKRSRDAFYRDYLRVIDDLKSMNWTPNWSEFFCANYCGYHLSCDDELHGLGEDPTKGGA